MELADHLENRQSAIELCRVVTGFDGFVDEMITVVDQRQTLEAFKRVEDISQFGDLIKQAAGRSSLREIVVTAMDAGGCAVNMGDGLAALGIHVDTFATFGEPIHPAFSEYGEVANLHSWGREPGRTLAFEFADGKLMFSAVRQLAEFEPGRVREYLQGGTYLDACRQARLVALTDWSMYPHMTAVWQLLQDTVFSQLEDRPWLFIDLVDPTSRSESDIREMLSVMKGFSASMRPVLGLNQNEANVLSRLLGLMQVEAADTAATADQANALRESLGIEQVVIHAHAYAASATRGGVFSTEGPYCANPRKSTGAGDRFNAGYALGLMLDLTIEECLLCAAASSGFFVRRARSARSDELVTFLREWAAGKLD